MSAMLDYGLPEEENQNQNQNQTDHQVGGDVEMELELNPQTSIAEIYNQDIDGPDGDRRTKFYPLPQDHHSQEEQESGLDPQKEEELELELEQRIIGKEIPTATPPSPFPLGSADLRTSVLNLQGTPITQLSTSRLFAYITHFKAAPLGLEWISDQSCNIVFASFSDARDGLVKLLSVKEYQDIATNQSELIPETEKLIDENNHEQVRKQLDSKTLDELLKVRKAKKLPSKLYNAQEKDLALKYSDPSLELPKELEEQEDLTSTLPSDVPEIYRDFEMEDRRRAREEYENGQGGEIQTLKNLRGQLFIRFALSSHDVKQKKAKDKSGWYKKYGDKAGKEVVGRLLNVGARDEKRELLQDELEEPGLENHSTNDSLQDRLSAFHTRRTSASGRGDRDRREQRRSDLDDELDEMRNQREMRDGRERSRSPEMRSRKESSVRIRGRGGVRAPTSSGMSAWDNADDYEGDDLVADGEEEDGVMRIGHGPFRSRMVSDQLEIQGSRSRTSDRWNDDDRNTAEQGGNNLGTSIKGTSTSSNGARRKGRGRFKAADLNDDLASRFGPPPNATNESLQDRLSSWKS